MLIRLLTGLLWLWLVLLATVYPLSAASRLPRGAGVRPPVLIIYSTWQQLPQPTHADIESLETSLGESLQFEQLLGHFPFAAQRVRLSDYRPGMLAHYPYAFVIVNRQASMLPAAFLRDVRGYHGACYWVNDGLNQLGPAFLKQLGLDYLRLETEPGYSTVRYHGITLGKGDAATHLIRVTAPERCHVLALAMADKRPAVPYIVRSGHFWYVADSPLANASIGDRYFAFSDTLFDFFGVQPRLPKRAFIRIEDINATDDQPQLRDMADRLYRLHVPFMMAVIPRYQDATFRPNG